VIPYGESKQESKNQSCGATLGFFFFNTITKASF
jgi:hypothetical protein